MKSSRLNGQSRVETNSLFVELNFRDCNVKDSSRDDESELSSHSLSIAITKLDREDRLLLVRYLQRLDCDQKNWPEFCCMFINRWMTAESNSLFPEHLKDKLKTSPFNSGFIYAPYLAALCLLSVSKYLYWLGWCHGSHFRIDQRSIVAWLVASSHR